MTSFFFVFFFHKAAQANLLSVTHIKHNTEVLQRITGQYAYNVKYVAAKWDILYSLYNPVSQRPGEPDSGAYSAEVPQLHPRRPDVILCG